MKEKITKTHLILLTILLLVIVISGINAADTFGWAAESIFIILFTMILMIIYNKTKFSDATYIFLLIYFSLILFAAHYSYLDVPGGDLIPLGWEGRNNFDRFVHLISGFVIAFASYDLLKKHNVNKTSLYVVPILAAVSLGAIYEVVEWIIADILFPNTGQVVLAAQGDEWDAQKDMGLAFIGSLFMMLIIWIKEKIKITS